MITKRFVRWYVAIVGILVCATLYVALPANAGCIGHECGGPYVMPEPQPLVLNMGRGAARDTMSIVIKPFR